MHAVDTTLSDGRRLLIGCDTGAVVISQEGYDGTIEVIAALDQSAAWTLYEIGYLMVMRPPVIMPNLNHADALESPE